ncbi:MAG TPA: hypothetical protein VM639_15635 [Dongiaceae bacterium]|nr:hypothetical protein [Dongiaceae bacterium]
MRAPFFEAIMIVTGGFMVLTVWLGYDGLIHDSRLYTLQALNAVDPARYGKDIFLAYGSQDQFTLFSPFYGLAVRLLGVFAANLMLYLLGAALWLTATVRLGTRLDVPVLIILAFFIMLPMYYGPTHPDLHGRDVTGFQVKESFVTPRLYAEGFCIFALGLLLAGRRVAASASWLLGFVLHPVMGLGAFQVGYLLELLKSPRRWLWLAVAMAGALAVVTAGLSGISPANRLFVVVAGDWLEAVSLRSTASIVLWHKGLAHAAVDAMLAATLLLDHRPLVQRLGKATLIAAGFGLFAYWIGWDILHLELFLQAQPWRVVWVLTLVSRLAITLLAAAWWRGDTRKGMALWVFLPAIGLEGWPQVFLALVGITLAFAAEMTSVERGSSRTEKLIRLCAVMASVAGFALSAMVTARYVFDVSQASSGGASTSSLLAAMEIGAVFLRLKPALVLAIALGIVWAYRYRGWMLPGLLALIPAFLLTFFWTLTLLQGEVARTYHLISMMRTAAGNLSRSGDILWEGDPDLVWVGLGRTSYLSPEQQNVVAFSRDAAIEILRRAKHLEVTGAPAANLRYRTSWLTYGHPWAPRALPRLCEDPMIAYVVADRQPYRALIALDASKYGAGALYIYDCADLIPE